jgi:hypothetical protein
MATLRLISTFLHKEFIVINLSEIYGDKIYYPKRTLPKAYILQFIVWEVFFNLVIAFGLTEIFNITWEYAVLKVYGLLFVYGLFKPLISWPFEFIYFNVFTRKYLASEMRHYLKVFSIPLNSDNISTYDDFLLSAAFNNNLDSNSRVLAAMQYSGVVNRIAAKPRLEKDYSKAWLSVLTELRMNNQIVIDEY